MKKFFFSSTLLCFGFLAAAQIQDWDAINMQRLQTTRTGMTILGGWAIGNLAAGALLVGRREGESKYFHQMNLGWGAVNLAIAGFGYFNALHTDPSAFDLYTTVSEQHRLQKILLFNTGLDVGYMLGGLYLIERSKTASKNPGRLKGFGQSIILQGAFLFIFDLTLALILNKQNDQLKPLLGGLSFNGQELGLLFYF